jgi:hypothetical protein
LSEDPSQQSNLAAANPEKLKEMLTNFEAIRGGSYNNIEQLELK